MLDDDTKALVLAVKDLLKDLRVRGLNDDAIDSLIKKDGLYQLRKVDTVK